MTGGRHGDLRRGRPAQALLGPALLGLGLLAAAGCAAPGSSQQGGGSAGQADRPQAGPLPESLPKSLRSADLVGLSGSDLQGRFGPPMLTFAEPPAEVWRYSAAQCVALFFLYPAESGGGPALVRHVEVLPPEAAGGSSACLQQIGDRGTV